MFELVNVELTNFRSFANASFSPLGLGQGMTAINGFNGAGKSSITHAICWAFYGITPDGVPVKALRRQGSDGEVRATVTFRHEGDTIVISRALRGRNDSTVASISVNSVEETSVSTKTATAWIVNRLGLDAEAFLTAFVVRQKELDNLVKARPAERRKAIERLAGIERMSSALELARAESRQQQRILDALPESEDPVVAKEKNDSAILEMSEALTLVNALEDEKASAEEKVNHSKSLLAQAESAESIKQQAEHKLELAEQAVLRLKDDVSRLSEESQGYESLDEVRASAENARTAFNDADNKVRSVNAFIDKSNADAERLEKASAHLVSAGGLVEKYRGVENELEDSLSQLPLIDESDISALEDSVRELTQEKGAIRGEWNRLNKAISNLNESNIEHAECPTCLRALEDVSILLSSLTSSRDTIQKQGEELANRIKEKESELSLIKQTQSNRNSILAKIESNRQALSNALEAFERAKDEESKLSELAETSAEQAYEAQVAAKSAEESLPSLKESESLAQKQLRLVENAVKAAEELPGVQVRLEHAVRAMGVAQAELDIAIEALESIDIPTIENDLLIANSQLKNLVERLAQAKADYNFAARSVELTKNALEVAIKSESTKRKAMANLEASLALSTAMDEFRRDRLARLAPELSEVASDLISRMTDGKYSTVELDEDFTPIITDSTGAQRPVAWLSGGEESAVALALRVAIGEVLAGQRGGLLILDEVLTAQDPFRRQATMAAIRALPRQVITINHVSEATDMVDLVAEVVDDGDGASIIVESSPGDLMGSNISDEALNSK